MRFTGRRVRGDGLVGVRLMDQPNEERLERSTTLAGSFALLLPGSNGHIADRQLQSNAALLPTDSGTVASPHLGREG